MRISSMVYVNFFRILFGIINKLEERDDTGEDESSDEHYEYSADVFDFERVRLGVLLLVLQTRTAGFPPLVIELLDGSLFLHLKNLKRYIISIRRA